MNYQTMNWDAEAEHLKQAFGLVEPCEWVEAVTTSGLSSHGLVVKSSDDDPVLCESGDRVGIAYGNTGIYFGLRRNDEDYCSAYLNWDGAAPKWWVARGSDIAPLKHALSRLATLSTVIRTALNISAHEQLEWALE